MKTQILAWSILTPLTSTCLVVCNVYLDEHAVGQRLQFRHIICRSVRLREDAQAVALSDQNVVLSCISCTKLAQSSMAVTVTMLQVQLCNAVA